MSYWVYAVYNHKHKKIYIGQTSDLEKRVLEHNDSGNLTHKYTRKFDGLWVEIYREEVKTRIEALRREKQLKSYRGREFIKKHIPL